MPDHSEIPSRETEYTGFVWTTLCGWWSHNSVVKEVKLVPRLLLRNQFVQFAKWVQRGAWLGKLPVILIGQTTFVKRNLSVKYGIVSTVKTSLAQWRSCLTHWSTLLCYAARKLFWGRLSGVFQWTFVRMTDSEIVGPITRQRRATLSNTVHGSLKNLTELNGGLNEKSDRAGTTRRKAQSKTTENANDKSKRKSRGDKLR